VQGAGVNQGVFAGKKRRCAAVVGAFEAYDRARGRTGGGECGPLGYGA
jgi:hypothetical protein